MCLNDRIVCTFIVFYLRKDIRYIWVYNIVFVVIGSICILALLRFWLLHFFLSDLWFCWCCMWKAHISACLWMFQTFRWLCETCILPVDESSGETSCWDSTFSISDCCRTVCALTLLSWSSSVWLSAISGTRLGQVLFHRDFSCIAVLLFVLSMLVYVIGYRKYLTNHLGYKSLLSLYTFVSSLLLKCISIFWCYFQWAFIREGCLVFYLYFVTDLNLAVKMFDVWLLFCIM